jgi:hypothetical protein
MYFLVVKVKHMLGVCLAGRWEEVGIRWRVWTRTGIYVLLKLVDTVWFLVRKVEPYYGKYKGILATDNMVQLKRHYGSATGSLLEDMY